MRKKDYELYMDIACRVAQQSTAVRLKVGAVLVKGTNILCYGYNGQPPGWDNVCENEVDGVLVSKPTVLHAEKNILRKMTNSHDTIEGSTLFITHNPCPVCSADFIGLGLERLVYKDAYRDSSGIMALSKDGVDVVQYDELIRRFDDEQPKAEPCPECGADLKCASGGGVKCTKCSYWFCF